MRFFSGILVSFAGATLLRTRRQAQAKDGAGDEPAIETPEQIKERFGQMDGVLEILFTLSCRAKHTTDVHGQALHHLKQKGGAWTDDDLNTAMKNFESKNLLQMREACGHITAEHEKKCREGCGVRWHAQADERDACDSKCETVYKKFDAACIEKVRHLKDVYSAERTNKLGRNKCLTNHCAPFPEMAMKADLEAQKAALEEKCTTACSADTIEAQCQGSWDLSGVKGVATIGKGWEVEGMGTVYNSAGAQASAEEACTDNGKAKSCFTEKSATVKADDKSCNEAAESNCQMSLEGCRSGDAADDRGVGFCEERNRQCLKNEKSACHQKYDAGLAAAKKECLSSAGEAMKSCVDGKLTAAKSEFLSKCNEGAGKTCDEDCKKSCELDKMKECQDSHAPPESEGPLGDITSVFCKEVWALLNDSSAVDPETGDPLVSLLETTTML